MKNLELPACLQNALTVRDLIEELQGLDPDLPVVLSYKYGDRPNTEVAEIVRCADEDSVEWSEYHRAFKVVNQDRDSEEVQPAGYAAVVLSG